MNPYREQPPKPFVVEHARRRRSTRKTIGAVLIAVQACDAYFAVRSGMWGLWIVGSFYAILIACLGRSRTPFTLQ
jgi:hypothetical protein